MKRVEILANLCIGEDKQIPKMKKKNFSYNGRNVNKVQKINTSNLCDLRMRLNTVSDGEDAVVLSSLFNAKSSPKS